MTGALRPLRVVQLGFVGTDPFTSSCKGKASCVEFAEGGDGQCRQVSVGELGQKGLYVKKGKLLEGSKLAGLKHCTELGTRGSRSAGLNHGGPCEAP